MKEEIQKLEGEVEEKAKLWAKVGELEDVK